MKKFYEAPALFVDEYVADTMIASSGWGDDMEAKNGNPKNQNCYGCNTQPGELYIDDYCYINPVEQPEWHSAYC